MIIEICIVCLVLVALVFCWRIHKRLLAFKNVQTQVEPSFRKFDGLLGQIYRYIEQLRKTTQDSKTYFDENAPKIQELKDDLDILIQHSNRIAKRLDALIDQAIQTEASLKQTIHNINKAPATTPQAHEVSPSKQEEISKLTPDISIKSAPDLSLVSQPNLTQNSTIQSTPAATPQKTMPMNMNVLQHMKELR